MFRDDRPERPAADNDYIEVARSSRNTLARAFLGFLQRVAEETAHVVECE
jgi:hypothetical protein